MFQQICTYHPTQNAVAPQKDLCLWQWNGGTILIPFRIQAFEQIDQEIDLE